ncbi:Uma2 family endonuclease [Nocardia sp. NPDC058519]|uniref:Uma2 family endonuclease n=1 Tax=Nocardia sp. NPDC058519 TaxID=3346535 RepID=UPI003669D16B
MSGAYDWSWLRNDMPVIDLDIYLEMPTELARTIEVKDGMLVHCESPSPNHISVARVIEAALRDAARDRPSDAPCPRASGDLDMLVSEVPFGFRRPDAILYRCVEADRGRWRRKPTAADALLVVEIVSPGTVTADCVDKRAEYAKLGIAQYWIVRMVNDDGLVSSIEQLRLTSDGRYVTERIGLRGQDPVIAVTAIDPVKVEIPWAELDLDIE